MLLTSHGSSSLESQKARAIILRGKAGKSTRLNALAGTCPDRGNIGDGRALAWPWADDGDAEGFLLSDAYLGMHWV